MPVTDLQAREWMHDKLFWNPKKYSESEQLAHDCAEALGVYEVESTNVDSTPTIPDWLFVEASSTMRSFEDGGLKLNF